MPDLTILIVDDDAGDRKAIRRSLKAVRPDAAVFEANRAAQAFDFDAAVPDIVLLDHRLPGRSGLDILARLLSLWPRAGIVLMTGQGDEDIAKSAIQAGAVDYIGKRAITPEGLDRLVSGAQDRAERRWKDRARQDDLMSFSDVLVHDFKAPIRAVKALAEQIQDDVARGDMDEVRDCAQDLCLASAQMAELVDSLAAHIRHDREVDFKEALLTELIGRAETALSQEIAASAAAVTRDFEDVMLHCSPPQVSQLLQNLLSNALKYRGEAPPRITISASLSDGGGAVVRVADNGIGVPEPFRRGIFDPFKRVPGRAHLPGTGLGLATCKKILDRHGGTIWCEAGAAGGAVFAFAMPRARLATSPPAELTCKRA